jgi:hypothetical protein
MNTTSLLTRTVLATVLLSASVVAFARSGGGPRGGEFQPDVAESVSHGHDSTRAVTLPASRAASTADSAPAAVPAVTNTEPGKTRAEVRAELLEAEEAGVIPVRRNDYPPSARTIARNRVIFAQAEMAWHKNDQVALSAR